MRKPLSDKERLGFMLDNISELESALTKITFEEYQGNLIIRHGITKILQNICETSVYITDVIKSEYPLIEWRKMKTMRNVLIHEYFGIDYMIVWDTVVNEIPALKSGINNILSEKYNG